jgi:cobalamin biosynthesis Mg chelatase CobN
MACFPGLAVAEESSGAQYDVDPVPAVPGDENDGPSKKNSGGSDPSDESAEANGSNTPGGAGSGGDGSDDGGSGSGSGQSTQGSGGGDAQRADGSKAAGGDIAKAQSLETKGSPVSSSSDDGSSPLVPILIAVAVLAAISIGAFYYRQRRQGPGSTVSPNAN